MKNIRCGILMLGILFTWGQLRAQESEIIYLSGKGFDDPVQWEFYCSDGRNSRTWTTIGVPSCWEQQGFGAYSYGHVRFDQRLKEEGHYRFSFLAERNWKDKQVELVFEGVMTDALVKINGKKAGAVHQGAFYPFSYDISRLLKYGKENRLEVFVKKFSDNTSVNEAERNADYWVFGGIFRPVYLEIRPQRHIESVAVDARADGGFAAEVILGGPGEAGVVEAEILERDALVALFKSESKKDSERIYLEGKVDQPLLWSPEFPHLYQARFTLKDMDGKPLHQWTERIGFRTVELRAQDGIYVNGERIKYKGVCRHSFHPDHGRTSSKAFSIEVVNLLKDMNMNAVRMSHYPPDRHFLDVCDSLGLFVLDELAGWQRPSYDSVVGRKLLKAMVERDVNHPSVLMWNNGNEGGWNTAYDQDFAKLDIQGREVNHPWAVHGKSNTAHYVNYDYLSQDHFAPRKVFFPTELLHGLYDGGHGAGLEDFWLRMWDHPLCAGAFLWVFADETVKRSDSGELDSDGNHAPDGILGPYHEKEASFYTIREIWSPVHFEKRYITPEFNGVFRIQNRFHYTRLDQCSFTYHWLKLQGPEDPGLTKPDLIEFGGVLTDYGKPEVDALEPGQIGSLRIPLYENWREADVLYIEAKDPHGRLIHQWSWPVKSPMEFYVEKLPVTPSSAGVNVEDKPESLILSSGEVSMEISKQNGQIMKVLSKGAVLPLSNGPVFLQEAPDLKALQHFARAEDHHVVADFGRAGRLEWVMHPGGLVDMRLRYQPEGSELTYTGALFTYPEETIRSVKYLGRGPYRVWKNRRKGVEFNVWEKAYNNTITGHAVFDYPEFKGYHSDLYWVRFTDRENRHFTVYSQTEDLFLSLFTPEEAPNPARTTLEHPRGDIGFMLGIPAIGTKFKEAGELGPQSRPYQYLSRRVENGALQIELSFDFR